MKRMMPLMAAVLLLSGGSAVFGQAPEESTKARAKSAMSDTDVTYGKIKEFTAGQKVVIDIDNAPDKSFDLADKDLSVKLPKGVKVGDTVKITEHDVAGKTKSVVIAKHSGGGVAHGDKDPHKP